MEESFTKFIFCYKLVECKNGMTESVGTQELFHTIVVYSKPPLKKLVFLTKIPVY